MSVHFPVIRVAAVVLLALGASVSAQEPARVRIAVSSADAVLSDLKQIVTLTPNKTLKKEAKNLEDLLKEGFLGGIDLTKPMRMDVVLGKDGAMIEPSLPIAKLEPAKPKKGDSFFENLDGFEYKVKKLPDGSYEITEAKNKKAKPMYLREVDGYAIIAGKAPPAGAANPVNGVKGLLGGGYDIAAELKNDAAGTATRKADFEAMRKELEAAIKFKRGEDPAEFELRKLSTTQSFDEAQRIVVEADTLKIGWTTAEGAASGKGDLLLTALPGTSLLASIQQMADTPNYFANVPLHAKPALSGKLRFPLDQFRKDLAKARHPIARAATKASIANRTGLTPEGKEAALQAIDKLFDIFDASIDIGLEGYIDVHDDGAGKYTFVGGMRAEKAKVALEIAEMLPKIRDDWKVKANAVEHGGVTIHEITVAERRRPEYASIFGGEPILYVGASDKAVWAACGVNSLDELKAAIDEQAKPAPEKVDPAFLEVSMKFGPWVDLLEVMRKLEPKKENPTKQEVEAEKERDQIRSLAIEAFKPGDELLTGKLHRDGNEIRGEMSVNEGVLRFIGSAIADFSKRNLN